MGQRWYERHAKKTFFLFLLLVIGILALLAEKVITARLGPQAYVMGTKRSIKMREFDPGYSEGFLVTEKAAKTSDGLVKKNYFIGIDENGFIKPAKIHENPDLVLAFLGGSTTECIVLDEKTRFPFLVGRNIEERTKLKVNSYNAARSGNNTLHSINILLNKVVPIKPDIVLMMHNVNDYIVLIYEKTYWNKNPSRSPIIEEKPSLKLIMKKLGESFELSRDLTIPNLYRQVKNLWPRKIGGDFQEADEFQEIRGKKLIIEKEYLLKEFSMNLQTFLDICRARKIMPVLLTMASRFKEKPDQFMVNSMKKLESQHGLNYQDLKDIFDSFNQAIRDKAQENRVVVCDLAKKVPQEKEFMTDLVHLNDRGANMVAQIISDDLEKPVSDLIKRNSDQQKYH